MNNTFSNEIIANKKLFQFCNKIISYNEIFNDETMRNIFLASLISADSLVDINSCDETLETIEFILNNIELFMLEEDNKKFIVNALHEAIDVSKQYKHNMLVTHHNIILEDEDFDDSLEMLDYPYVGIGKKPHNHCILGDEQIERYIGG